jgi:hypothetical protein
MGALEGSPVVAARSGEVPSPSAAFCRGGYARRPSSVVRSDVPCKTDLQPFRRRGYAALAADAADGRKR